MHHAPLSFLYLRPSVPSGTFLLELTWELNSPEKWLPVNPAKETAPNTRVRRARSVQQLPKSFVWTRRRPRATDWVSVPHPVSPQFLGPRLDSQCGCIWRWSLRKVTGNMGGEARVYRISVLVRRGTRQLLLPPCTAHMDEAVRRHTAAGRLPASKKAPPQKLNLLAT